MLGSLPGYELADSLHATSNSAVYRGRRLADEQPVIIKLLNKRYPSPVEKARFQQEYELTRQLQGTFIIQALDLLPHERSLVMILEDVGGSSLRTLLAQGVMDLAARLELALKLAGALAELHAQGVMHKDFNPANVIVNPESGALRLIDFGLATRLSREHPTLQPPEHLEGTLAYLSPEQTGRMNREIDYRTDLYSLGVTLYELFTGRLPFRSAEPMELVHAHIAQQPRAPHELDPALPEVLSDLILKLLAKRAEARYQSAHGVRADLAEIQRQWQTEGRLEAFPLGRYDASPRFQLSQTLYGRDEALAALKGAVARSSAGATELLLVSGPTGVGKSALVHELQRTLGHQPGHFIVGRFDPFQRALPYSALLQAFRELLRQLLTASDTQLAAWRERLLAALAGNGQLLIEVLPELELLIGPQPAVPELGPAESQSRFRLLFQNFLGVFASEAHPLVIFLDDLHRADPPSLRLLEQLLSDPLRHHLLVIGSYQEEAAQPLQALLASLREIALPISEVCLGPLDLEAVTQFVADTLQREPGEVAPLAEILFAKTQGNPFFMGEFLTQLYQKGLLSFSPPDPQAEQAAGWQWELAAIRAEGITDNVVTLMRDKVAQLPEAARVTLQVAACLGSPFELTTLARVQAQSPGEVAEYLWPTLEAGLLQPMGESYRLVRRAPASEEDELAETLDPLYRFPHERVQQAAYELLPIEERPALHLRVGRLLQGARNGSGVEDSLFEIVGHLNRGAALIEAAQEREVLARLNLQAGQRAKSTNAYEPAYHYLIQGIKLLPPTHWESHYELALDLHLAALESAFLQADFAEMARLAGIVRDHARTLLDRARLYEVQIQAHAAEGRLREAVESGLEILAEFGLTFPEQPKRLHTLLAFLRTRLMLARKQPAALAELPTMEEPLERAKIRLLRLTAGPVFFATPALYPLFIFKMVQLSVRHGNAPVSATGYVTYGLILCELGQIEQGYAFGRLGMTLAERFDIQEFRTHLIALYNIGVHHWKEPLHETLPALVGGFERGMALGDLPYAGLNIVAYGQHAMVLGLPLASLQESLSHYRSAIQRVFSHQLFANGMNVLQQTAATLLEGGEAPDMLDGAYMVEASEVATMQANGDYTNLALFHVMKELLSYHFGQYEALLEHAEAVERYRESARGVAWIAGLHYLYHSLALLALYPSASAEQQRTYLKQVEANQKKMALWAHHAPMNYQHRYELVEAERARVAGDAARAMSHYQQAIDLAHTHAYPVDEALAHELAGRYYLAREMRYVAQAHLRDAHYGYRQWGARAKVAQLERDYPDFFLHPEEPVTTRRSSQTITSSSSATTSRAGELDLAAVIKASQAISSEIELDRLLDTLLRIVMENAGARRGALLLADGGQLRVEAAGRVDPPEIQLLAGTPLAESDFLAPSVVRYVERTRQDVVIDDATREALFANDPYIQRRRPHAILATPLLNQGQLIGVLYLENKLSVGAFTPARVEMVQLLGTQAAISITNAKAIAARAEQARVRMEKELLEQRAQDLAELNANKDRFFSIISHDLRSPFNSLLGMSQLLRRMADTMERAEIQLFADRIYTAGRNVLTLLDNLLHWSQVQAGRMEFQPETLDLREVVQQTLSLFKESAANKEIRLTSTLEEPMVVYTDPLMVDTVIRNLVSNALKFTPAGGEVRLLAHPRGEMVAVSVQDTGVGISPTNQAKLFRLDVTHSTLGTAEEQGTGLGLLLCKELVEKQGGAIWIESEVGAGTTFTFTVPRPTAER